MPEIIACPDCGRKLRVPDDLLGRKVKCPGCSINFTASVIGDAPPPLPQQVGTEPRGGRKKADRYDDDPPRRRRDRDDRDDVDDEAGDDDGDSPRSLRATWKKVRSGISFIIISIWVYLGAIGVFIIGMLFLTGMGADSAFRGNFSGAASAGAGMIALGLFVQVANLASMGLRVTGYAFGMAVPPKRNNAVRGLAIATFITGAANAALALLLLIITMIQNMDAVAGNFSFTALAGGGSLGPLMLIEWLTWVGASIVFLFYLRSLCLSIRKDNVASTVTTYMISVGSLGLVVFLLWIFIFGVAVLGIGSSSVQTARSAGGMAIIGCGLMGIASLAALGLFIWYIVILHQIRGVVDSYIRKL